ncbi:hypothetical protein GW17_00000560 [Ensete ventricosum]|nr:hypothetical protein GW17_00000560 [Ensete ventricosum]
MLGAFGPVAGGCVSTSLMLSTNGLLLFLLLDVFVPATSHFVLSYTLTHCVYDKVV